VNPPVKITDHAVLRYLERTGQIDVDAVRAEIEAKVARGIAAGVSLGPGMFKVVMPGAVFVVVDGRVVTTLSPEMRPHGRRRRGAR
jgi:hypothetical protein